MFGFGKKQKQNSNADATWELGMRTMKSDLKNPAQEIHETIAFPSSTPLKKDETKEKENLSNLVKNPVAVPGQVPPNLPTIDNSLPEQKASSLPEDTIQESNLKLSETLEKKDAYFSTKNDIQTENKNVPQVKLAHQADINFVGYSPPHKKEPETPVKIKNKIGETDKQEAAPVSQAEKSGVNKILLALTAIVFLLTLSSGAYYYFFILNPQNETTEVTPIKPENETSTIPIKNGPGNENGNEIIEEISGPESLANASVLSLVNADLVSSLGSIELDSRGTFFRIKNVDNENVFTPGELLALLKINLSEVESGIIDGWLFFKKDSTDSVDTGIVFEIKDTEATKSSIMKLENELPSRITGIFVGKTAPIIQGSVEFKNSIYDERARYFNFTPNDPAASIDWAMITSQGANYLIFANSKDAMGQILSQIGQ